jgi:hypothetical protein
VRFGWMQYVRLKIFGLVAPMLLPIWTFVYLMSVIFSSTNFDASKYQC